jgi:hypothetical protein
VEQQKVLELERKVSSFSLAQLLDLAEKAGITVKSLESRTYGGFARTILKAPPDKRDIFVMTLEEVSKLVTKRYIS